MSAAAGTDLVAARDPFVDGQFVGGDGEPLAIRSPASEAVVATVTTSTTPARSTTTLAAFESIVKKLKKLTATNPTEAGSAAAAFPAEWMSCPMIAAAIATATTVRSRLKRSLMATA